MSCNPESGLSCGNLGGLSGYGGYYAHFGSRPALLSRPPARILSPVLQTKPGQAGFRLVSASGDCGGLLPYLRDQATGSSPPGLGLRADQRPGRSCLFCIHGPSVSSGGPVGGLSPGQRLGTAFHHPLGHAVPQGAVDDLGASGHPLDSGRALSHQCALAGGSMETLASTGEPRISLGSLDRLLHLCLFDH